MERKIESKIARRSNHRSRGAQILTFPLEHSNAKTILLYLLLAGSLDLPDHGHGLGLILRCAAKFGSVVKKLSLLLMP